MIFVYHFVANSEFGDRAGKFLSRVEAGRCRLVTSVLSLMETLVVPKRHGAEAVVRRYRDFFSAFPNLRVVGIDREIAELASELRARYGLKTPDALQFATAIREHADAFVTEDRRLRSIPGLKVLSLDQALRR